MLSIYLPILKQIKAQYFLKEWTHLKQKLLSVVKENVLQMTPIYSILSCFFIQLDFLKNDFLTHPLINKTYSFSALRCIFFPDVHSDSETFLLFLLCLLSFDEPDVFFSPVFPSASFSQLSPVISGSSRSPDRKHTLTRPDLQLIRSSLCSYLRLAALLSWHDFSFIFIFLFFPAPSPPPWDNHLKIK